MKITIDRKKCEGHAKCVEVASKVFQLDKTMVATIVDSQGDTEEKITFAAKLCPTKAIALEDESGRKLFPQDSESGA